ncbi:response regulator transcription factor [Achromobacter pestifer]|uniref:Virulence factors putative positive transcription regulator BvgA n=1 Tax=Achromobacter pestifer TaxID=1353889 RepID=A0A6S6YVA0_9BURK|nr:response regulator transcription factor [Achromobacter pestifer]CAB3640052.1 Virulence factors putative positive transcription regulator BvgA [Achromobacter pestifer]
MNTILIVDDHPLVRLAVRMLLETNGFNVVGEVGNGIEAVQAFRDLSPDVVILDIGIPKLDGLSVISRMLAINPATNVLVLTSQSSEAFCHRCMQAGAKGFISKDEDLNKLVSAIKAVMAGYSVFPSMSVASEHGRLPEPDMIKRLSDREMMVLQYLAQGQSNKEIGETLLISNKTVSTYKTRLLQKLGMASVVELAEFAKRNLLLGVPDADDA